MANKIIIKRGTKEPTTSNLTSIGEIAFDYQNEKLYVRASSKVVCINVTTTGEGSTATKKNATIVDPVTPKVERII